MLLYTMLYIVLAYLMLFAALTNSVCLNNASFFFLFKYFLCQGYELSGEIALKNNHYYYYYDIYQYLIHQHPTSQYDIYDDICLLAESIDDVECSLHRLETSAAKIGLTINYNKTKAMHLGQASVRHVRFVNGDPVDSCDKFEYLGVPTSNAETVFLSRLSKAWAAATKLRSIFNSKANDAIKIGLC